MISKNQIKHLTKLRKDKQYRYEVGRALVVGEKLCSELQTLETYTDSADVIKKITGLPSPESIIAEVAIPQEQDLLKTQRIIVLDHISDPGNLGTIIRTALAFGFDGALLLGGVDPFNDKAIASSKGAAFRLPLSRANIETLPHTLYVADLLGVPFTECQFEKPCALVLGNESHGPSIKTGTKITIPIAQIESLNVAIAGGIIMHEMKRHG